MASYTVRGALGYGDGFEYVNYDQKIGYYGQSSDGYTICLLGPYYGGGEGLLCDVTAARSRLFASARCGVPKYPYLTRRLAAPRPAG